MNSTGSLAEGKRLRRAGWRQSLCSEYQPHDWTYFACATQVPHDLAELSPAQFCLSPDVRAESGRSTA
ncbi:hypothetical protein CEXT_64761 [Caerostris extrusa]|uniref:Uncharacterized protein n=1 Tax=Caerostris extrusa TaxID=172846 RepID=A0AAV4RKR0_CAEEX|nr:hypothetical protein CEXT_64761 [Caerostris extrusa]